MSSRGRKKSGVDNNQFYMIGYARNAGESMYPTNTLGFFLVHHSISDPQTNCVRKVPARDEDRKLPNQFCKHHLSLPASLIS